MAVTVVRDRLTIELSGIDADYVWSTLFTAGKDAEVGPMIDWILFIPGQANDKMVIKHKTDAGPTGFQATCLTADERYVYYHGARFPFVVDFSDCTLTANHKLIIQLWPRQQ